MFTVTKLLIIFKTLKQISLKPIIKRFDHNY